MKGSFPIPAWRLTEGTAIVADDESVFISVLYQQPERAVKRLCPSRLARIIKRILSICERVTFLFHPSARECGDKM
jgi:hypothetical protein